MSPWDQSLTYLASTKIDVNSAIFLSSNTNFIYVVSSVAIQSQYWMLPSFLSFKASIECQDLFFHPKPVLDGVTFSVVQSQYWTLWAFLSFKASIESQGLFFPSKASIGCCYLFCRPKPVLDALSFSFIQSQYWMSWSFVSIQSHYWMLWLFLSSKAIIRRWVFPSFKASIECQDPFHSFKASIGCCDLFSRLKPILDVEFSLHSKLVLNVKISFTHSKPALDVVIFSLV